MAFTLKFFQATLLTFMLSYAAADGNTRMCSSRQLPATNMVNSLAFRLEEILDTESNYIFSPLSISIALAMVYIGARGTTREQMSDALDYNIVGKNCLPNKISESFRELIQSLQNNGADYEFLVANGAFIQKGLNVTTYFSTNLQKHFNTRIQFLNFQREEVAAMNAINAWVANYTKGKISQLLAEPLNHVTMLVLLNAVYFKGLWYLPFDEKISYNGSFYRIDKGEKVVPFMSMKNEIYNYYDKEKKYFIIELEYEGGNVSMVLILPQNREEFPRYELTNELLCELRQKFQHTPVTVTIPRFNLEFKRELSRDMSKMGMPELFSDRADLSAINEYSDLHVSMMVHKAVIEVNEKGSTAAGIIGMEIDSRNRVSQNDSFMADHPFLFYIIHKDTNTILFSGRVVDP